jgi:hypothetical protein
MAAARQRTILVLQRHTCPSQDLRSRHSNRTFDQMEASFACGSMVLFVLLHEIFALCAKISCKRMGFSALLAATYPSGFVTA